MKRFLAICAVALVMSALLGCSNSAASSSGQSSDDSAIEAESATSDEFVSDVMDSIAGLVGAGEEITDVAMGSNELTVYVDLGEGDDSPEAIEERAASRASAITDAILALDRYDDLWQTITVDFGAIGRVSCEKGDLDTSGSARHFDSAAMVLEDGR